MDNHVKPEDMPSALIVVSDMEIDSSQGITEKKKFEYGRWGKQLDTPEFHEEYLKDIAKSWSFYDDVKAYYESYGYKIPNVIFWNVDSRNDVFHADSNRKGVQLVSGQSTAVFKQLMENIGLTAYEAMLKVIGDERYSCVTVE